MLMAASDPARYGSRGKPHVQTSRGSLSRNLIARACSKGSRIPIGLALAVIAGVLSVAGTAGAVAPTDDLTRLVVAGNTAKFADDARTTLSSTPAWRKFEAATGVGWHTEWNVATALPHLSIPALFDAAAFSGVLPAGMTGREARAAALDASRVDRMSRAIYAALRASYPNLPDDQDLVYTAIEKQANVWWVVYGQTAGGTPVENARADFRYSSDGRLLYLGLDLVPAAQPATATLDQAAAEQAAIQSLGQGGLSLNHLSTATGVVLASRPQHTAMAWVAPTPSAASHLVVLPVYTTNGARVDLHSAWVVRTKVSNPAARFVSWIDATDGTVLRRLNEFDYDTISGTANGDINPTTPYDPYVNLTSAHLGLTVVGVGDAVTDVNGNFSVNTPDSSPRTVTSGLGGPWGQAENQGGAQPFFSGQATPGVPFTLTFNDTNSDPASRDAFYYAMLEHDYIRAIDPTFTGMDYVVPIYTNENQTCNAYWDGYAINFFAEGGGCANTGQIQDVVEHEYGHGVTQYIYAPYAPDGGQNEGMSDYIAASMTDQPLIGRGFYGPGTYLRTCLNDTKWPAPECGGEVHCMGQIISGSLYLMRENLVAKFGHARGVSHADSLFHFARYGRSPTMEGYYFDVLAVDDNNGTLVDGTPNDQQIIEGFYDGHNLGPGWTLSIIDTPLTDTENPNGPYPVVAVFSSPANIESDSCAVYVTTQPISGGPTTGPFRVAMTPTGNIREFVGNIPGQPLGTKISYYISGACDTLGITAVDPAGAPGTQYTFNVNLDTQPPKIQHSPLYNQSYAVWPVPVAAVVTDNIGVSAVSVDWKKNGADQTSFPLNQVGNTTTYNGIFNGAVVEGDVIQYRIKAVDVSQNKNTAYFPPLGYIQFTITHDFVDNVEHGPQTWTHAVGKPGFNDQWHIDTKRSHSASHAWKFGDTGNGNYLDSSDGVLITPPIQLTTKATLSFWHWIYAESQGANQAWDGAVVELSTNAGATWTEIVPQGGYGYTIINNPASPFPPGYPCWSGSYDWRQAQFDLSAFANQTVQIRCRFGSDGAVNYEGWYVDDFDLNPGENPTDVSQGSVPPTKSGILGANPNPFGTSTRISFAVAAGSENVRLDIVDVTGRKVRTLASSRIDPGVHQLVWDGKGENGRALGSGIYFARLRAGKDEFTSKVLVVK